VNNILEKTYKLVIQAVNQRNKPIKNIGVKVFRAEKNPISIEQWTENLRNGTPFKQLMLATATDENGNIATEQAEGTYEISVETVGLKTCELSQNTDMVFVEPKKHWW
jgi:hypothetical protein